MVLDLGRSRHPGGRKRDLKLSWLLKVSCRICEELDEAMLQLALDPAMPKSGAGVDKEVLIAGRNKFLDFFKALTRCWRPVEWPILGPPPSRPSFSLPDRCPIVDLACDFCIETASSTSFPRPFTAFSFSDSGNFLSLHVFFENR